MPTSVIALSSDSWTLVAAASVVKFTAQPRPVQGRNAELMFRFEDSAPAASVGIGIGIDGTQAMTRDHGDGALYGRGNGSVVVAL